MNPQQYAGYILEISKKIPCYGETSKDEQFKYKILSHSRKQISKIEISKQLNNLYF